MAEGLAFAHSLARIASVRMAVIEEAVIRVSTAMTNTSLLGQALWREDAHEVKAKAISANTAIFFLRSLLFLNLELAQRI